MQTPAAQTPESPAVDTHDGALEFVILEAPDRATAETQYGADIEVGTDMEADHD
jgi:hypothetical protein